MTSSRQLQFGAGWRGAGLEHAGASEAQRRGFSGRFRRSRRLGDAPQESAEESPRGGGPLVRWRQRKRDETSLASGRQWKFQANLWPSLASQQHPSNTSFFLLLTVLTISAAAFLMGPQQTAALLVGASQTEEKQQQQQQQQQQQPQLQEQPLKQPSDPSLHTAPSAASQPGESGAEFGAGSGLASPKRALSSYLLYGGVAALPEHRLVPGAEAEVGVGARGNQSEAGGARSTSALERLLRDAGHSHASDRVDLALANEAWRGMRQRARSYAHDRAQLMRPALLALLDEARIQPACQSSLLSTLERLAQLDSWAVRMYNSFGNFPAAGLFEGTHTSMGSYHQCVGVAPNPTIGGPQYCTFKFQPLIPKRPRYHNILATIDNLANFTTSNDVSTCSFFPPPRERCSSGGGPNLGRRARAWTIGRPSGRRVGPVAVALADEQGGQIGHCLRPLDGPLLAGRSLSLAGQKLLCQAATPSD